MADIKKTVEIIFGMVDNVSSGVNDLAGNIDSAVNSIQGVSGPLANLAEDALKTEAAIIAMGVAFLGVSVHEAAQLQTAVNEIGTLFNATPEQVAKLKDEILDFGENAVFSFEDITKSTFDLISATGDVENAVSSLNDVQRGAVVGNASLGVAMDALTTITGSYGLEITDANEIMGAFIIAVQNGKTTLPELADSIGRTAATAAGSKLPYQDLLAAVAALTVGGVNTAESMTTLNAILKALATPTKELQTALGGTSIETDGFQAVMNKLKEATGGSFVEMTKLFPRIEATKGAVILANDAVGALSKTMGAMGNKATVIGDNFKLMSDNLELVTQNMQNRLKIALEKVGTELLPEWTNIVKSIGTIFSGAKIGLEDGAFDTVFTALNSFQVAFNEYAQGIAEVLPEAMQGLDFTGLIDSFEDLGFSISDIFGDLDLTKAEDLKKALQFAVDGVETLTRVVTGIVKSWEPAIKAIGFLIDSVNEMDNTTKENAGGIGGYAQQFEALTGAIDFTTASLSIITGSLAVLTGGKAVTYVTGLVKAMTLLNPVTAMVGAAFSATGFAVTANIRAYDEYIDRNRILWEDQQKTIENLTNTEEKLKEISETTGITVNSMDELSAAQKAGLVVFDEAAGKFVSTKKELRDFDEEVRVAAEGSTSWADAWRQAGGALSDMNVKFDASVIGVRNLAEEQEKLELEMDEARKAGLGFQTVLKDGVRVLETWGGATEDAAESLQKTEDELNNLTEKEKLLIEQTHEVELSLLSLASNEKIAHMEFQATIGVAQVEAQAEQVVAAFGSISNIIESLTTESVGLFQLLSDPKTSGFTSLALKDAIDTNQKLQEATLANETKLVNAQVSLLQQRADALIRGDANITINADNLQPELQAVLMSLLDNIQIEASQEGLELLL